jgi:hypothetical protein
MLTRTGFKRPAYERTRTVHTPIPEHLRRSASFSKADTMAEPVEKGNPLRSEPYRRLVAAMPCAYCRREKHSQHAHTNANKGKGIKNDDRDAMPLCADGYGLPGCHTLFDLYRLIPGGREAHVAQGAVWSAQTRAQIEASGQWPKNLPKWTNEPEPKN